MYVFTNIIQNPKGYPYWLKLVIYSDNGLTGTTTATGGGYVLNIGEISEEIDPFSGEYKPGGMSLELLNLGNLFSTSVFGGTIANMEARLWISYNSGTSYECLFYGRVLWQGLKRMDPDATETENQRFSVSCEHALLSLKEIEIDTDPDTGSNVPTTGIVTPGVTVESYAIEPNGTPRAGFSFNDYTFISLDGILQYIFSNVQFIAGATAPTLAYDSSAMQHKGKSLVGAGVEYDFDELHILFESPTVDTAETFFSFASGRFGAYALKNLQEMLKLFMDSLIMIPVTRLTESGGGFTLNVYFEPRFRPAASLTALTGTLDLTLTRSMSVQEWLDGFQVLTNGLPAEPNVTYSTVSYGGRTFELKNHLMTGPYFSVATYLLIYAHIIPAGAGLETIRHDGPTAQMLYGIVGSAVNTINQFKHLTGQTYYGSALTGGYYGVHGSAFNLLAANLNPLSRSSIYGPRGYEITAKTLATNNSGTMSVWDLRLLKKITIDSVTCQIVSIRRNVMDNTVSIRAIEVL
jgi:hypothetical protein